jgi:hypothetical protein
LKILSRLDSGDQDPNIAMSARGWLEPFAKSILFVSLTIGIVSRLGITLAKPLRRGRQATCPGELFHQNFEAPLRAHFAV